MAVTGQAMICLRAVDVVACCGFLSGAFSVL
jgi:hypothetical protein